MRTLLINAALSLALGVTGLPVLASQASAQDLEFSIGRQGPQLRMREECDPDYDDCYVERRAMRRCTEDRALDKAERMGIRRARIVSAGRSTIEVRGRSLDGERVYLTFGRQRSCPVLEY
jgi:hypothetical protein